MAFQPADIAWARRSKQAVLPLEDAALRLAPSHARYLLPGQQREAERSL